MMLILLPILGAILFYYYVVKPHHYWTNMGVKQKNLKSMMGDKWDFMMGNQSFPEMMQKVYNQWSDVRYFGRFQFFSPTLVLKDPELIKKITIDDFDHFTDHRSFASEDVDPLWGKNLFALKGEKWRHMRTILNPTFNGRKMRTMFVSLTECAENLVQHFLDRDEDVMTVEFKDIFTRFSSDALATTTFGIKMDSLEHPNNYFYLMAKETTNFKSLSKIMKFLIYILIPRLSKMLKLQLFSKKVSNFFHKIVGDTIKMREENSIVRQDMINILLQARMGIRIDEENGEIDTVFFNTQENDLGEANLPKGISNSDIVSQAMIFFLGGFETVANLMCFMGYELAINPDIQDKLRQEIRSTLEECNGKLTYDDLLKMKYMDMVISETLRKWPITAFMDRTCTKPYTIQPVTPEEKPVHLKEGDILWLPIFAIHRDSHHFPNPERFDPERFSELNKDSIKPCTYFPFGLGPRNCMGSKLALLETKTVFFHLLNSFELVPVEKSIIPLKLSKKEICLMSAGGFWFGLRRIEH